MVVISSALPGRVWGQARDRIGQALVAARGDVVPLFGLLLLIFGAFLFRLRAVVISDMDEGTYLYAGKLFASGLTPYRDFLVAHPPMIVLLAGGWERLFGSDIMAARIAYLTLILASTVPLYLITRRLTHSRMAGLFSVPVYTTGMLFLANMGRTVRLEPLMNAFLIVAFAAYLLRPDSLRWRFVVGIALAAAVLVKLVAVVPAGLLVFGDLLWPRPDRRFVRSWAVATAGAAVVLAPMAFWLLSQPYFIDDVVRSQLNRPGLPLHVRFGYLRQDFIRYPAIPVALAAAAWLVLWARDPRLRVVALTTLGATLALVFAFRTFFGYYLVQVLPWIAVVFAVVASAVARRLVSRWWPSLLLAGAVARRLVSRWWPSLLLAGAVALGGGAPLLYGEVYYRRGHGHVSSPAQIMPLLRDGEGYIYSMYPAFALWSGRELYPWYYTADSLIPRFTARIGDEDFVRVFSGSQALVLWRGELASYPKAQAYVERHFRLMYEDAYYALWVRSDDSNERR